MNIFFSNLLIVFLDLLARLPWKVLYKISDILCYVLFKVVKYRKNVIWSNLKNSFPEKSDAELSDIRKKFYQHFSDIIVETIKLRVVDPQEIKLRLTGNYEVLTNLFEQKKNVGLILGHRGNWEMANSYFSSFLPHDVLVVYKPLHNKAMDQWFFDMRSRFKSQLIPMKMIYAELKKDHPTPYILALANDQAPNPQTGYWTTFLNQDTGVFRGAEIISKLYDLTVVYLDIKKHETLRGHYVCHFNIITDNVQTFPQNAILQKQIELLEKDIRHQPHNWLWSHRRWKHERPVVLKPEQILHTANDEKIAD